MAGESPEAYQGMNDEIAEAIVPSWERRRADIERVAARCREWMLRELGAQAGETVLELAAALPVGPHADGRHTAAALAETRRVLRPGGRLVLAIWGAPERNPFFSAIAICRVQGEHMPPPDPAGPGLFSTASAARTAALLEGAGFTEGHGGADGPLRDPRCRRLRAVHRRGAGPIAMVLRGLTEADREAPKAQAEAALERFAGERGYRIPGVVLGAASTRGSATTRASPATAATSPGTSANRTPRTKSSPRPSGAKKLS